MYFILFLMQQKTLYCFASLYERPHVQTHKTGCGCAELGQVEDDVQHYQVHPLPWLLSNHRLEKVRSELTKCTLSNQLLLSNQGKGCT